MWSYALRRVLMTIPTLLLVITVCYLMLHATPGGPFDTERKVSAAVMANLQAKYHLDLPLWQQYLLYLKSLLQGDLGASFRYADWSVNELVGNALPVSLAIGGGALLLSVIIGVPEGAVAAKLAPGHDLDDLLQRADAAGKCDEGVGTFEHRMLALMHVLGDDQFVELAEGMARRFYIDEEFGYDARHVTAGGQYARGNCPHDALGAAAIH